MAFKRQRPRKKVCYFTKNKIDYIDYKDVELLKRFVIDRYLILTESWKWKSNIREEILLNKASIGL